VAEPRTRRVLPDWVSPAVRSATWLSIASGMAQFTVTAVIGDVAATFGASAATGAVAERLGRSATSVGTALAVIRLASLASLPAAAIADRLGRRRTLITMSVVGLGLTALAALAPGFWWFVALVALARPAMSAVNALAGVVVSEETRTADRSAAIGLVTAAYGLGAGLVAVLRGVVPGALDFRLVTALSLVPLVLLPLIARRLEEPALASRAAEHVERGLPGRIPQRYLRVTVVLGVVTGAIALGTGPAFTYLFVYGERVIGMSPGTLSLLVLGAAPFGLAGLVIGRAGADRIGRAPTAGLTMAATGVAVAWAYTGTPARLATGYLAAIMASSAFAPPAGALAAELVPTRVRATIAGWMTVAGVIGAVVGLVGFGALADLTGGFDGAALVVGALVVVSSVGFRWLPDTRSIELDDVDAADDITDATDSSATDASEHPDAPTGAA